jgi:hypothetical protein
MPYTYVPVVKDTEEVYAIREPNGTYTATVEVESEAWDLIDHLNGGCTMLPPPRVRGQTFTLVEIPETSSLLKE